MGASCNANNSQKSSTKVDDFEKTKPFPEGTFRRSPSGRVLQYLSRPIYRMALLQTLIHGLVLNDLGEIRRFGR